MKLTLPTQVTIILARLKSIGRHHYFIFTLLLLVGLAAAIFIVNQTLASPSDQSYYDQKLGESLKSSFDQQTIEKIEDLQKSSEGSTAPPPPGSGVRTNPFAE